MSCGLRSCGGFYEIFDEDMGFTVRLQQGDMAWVRGLPQESPRGHARASSRLLLMGNARVDLPATLPVVIQPLPLLDFRPLERSRFLPLYRASYLNYSIYRRRQAPASQGCKLHSQRSKAVCLHTVMVWPTYSNHLPTGIMLGIIGWISTVRR